MKQRGQTLFRPHPVLTATLNILPLTVRSCNVAALCRLAVSALFGAGNVIVAIAPTYARKPNRPGAKGLEANSFLIAEAGKRLNALPSHAFTTPPSFDTSTTAN